MNTLLTYAACITRHEKQLPPNAAAEAIDVLVLVLSREQSWKDAVAKEGFVSMHSRGTLMQML